MLKVYTITALTLVTALVLFVGPTSVSPNSSTTISVSPNPSTTMQPSISASVSASVPSYSSETTSHISPTSSLQCVSVMTPHQDHDDHDHDDHNHQDHHDEGCEAWKPSQNQCKVCSNGAAGPITIERTCSMANETRCEMTVESACEKYCADGSSHSPSVALVLLLTVATAFRYTVY